MIKKLLKSVREYKVPSILTPILMVGEAAMEIVIPFFMQFLIAEIREISIGNQADIGQIVLWGGLMLAAAVFALLCGIFGAKLSAKASSGFAHNLREDMYNNLQSFSFANIDNYSTASLITRITTDVTNVQNAYQMSIRMLVRAPVLFISATIMSCILEPIMGMTFVIAAIILGAIVAFCMIKVTPYFRMMFKKYDALNAVVQEDLTAIRVVKSYVREDYQMEKMKNATQEVYNYSIKAEKIFTILMPAVQFVMYATIIILLLMGSDMAISGWGNVDMSNMQALITYAMQVLSGVMMVAMCLNFIAMSKGSAERIVQVLEETTTLPKAKEQIAEVKDGSIDFDGVDFCYSQKADVAVLKQINLHIASGETIGIIGATGSGKSSLVSLIPRLYDATKGTVKVGGVDVRKYNLDALRNNVAMVLQKNVLFSGTISENLRWGDENATDEEVREAAIQACADEFIQNLPGKYDYDLGQGGVNVSGGQKQRLCIARAMLKHPKVIIFDDSTSAVDTKTDAIIRENLRKYAPETTKIIIAQRINSIQDADRIIVLDEGRIDGIGTHEELLATNEIYREVYESQVKGGEE
ncbi:MAG TPA: ABC transporter ATP-binding protein [Candidatus Coproplasma avicola]|uniref:ABC transporter ATP-binding protein n=1 Tax=Candidatus Coproplasma avicola TaxID=2840744 RepID=A0A9D1E6K9_9FIRM|nr:ABC transporter ATP-binding protein [Candidatus Coproplasma avicola]